MANNTARIPDEILRGFAKDEGFRGLQPDAQERIVQRWAQENTKYVPSAENILQKAAKAATGAMGMGTMGFANPLGPIQAGYGARDSVIDETVKDPIANFGVKVGTDPLSWMGAGAAAKGAEELVSNVKNPSGAFGKGIERLQGASPDKRVDFFHIINNAIDDPMAKKVIDKSGILDSFGGTKLTDVGTLSENLSNLTLQESQDLVNAMKSGVRQAVKEGTVKPTEIGIAKMFSELSKAQKGTFEGFDKVAKNYGAGKNMGKFLKTAGKQLPGALIRGAGLGTGGKLAYDAVSAASGK